jgi:hypothetical protein
LTGDVRRRHARRTHLKQHDRDAAISRLRGYNPPVPPTIIKSLIARRTSFAVQAHSRPGYWNRQLFYHRLT